MSFFAAVGDTEHISYIVCVVIRALFTFWKFRGLNTLHAAFVRTLGSSSRLEN